MKVNDKIIYKGTNDSFHTKGLQYQILAINPNTIHVTINKFKDAENGAYISKQLFHSLFQIEESK